MQCVFGIYAPLFGKQPEQFEKVTKRPIKVSRKLLKSINGRRNKICVIVKTGSKLIDVCGSCAFALRVVGQVMQATPEHNLSVSLYVIGLAQGKDASAKALPHIALKFFSVQNTFSYQSKSRRIPSAASGLRSKPRLCQPAAEKMPDGKMQKDSNRRGICQRSLSTLLTAQYNSDAETAGSQNHRRSSLSSA